MLGHRLIETFGSPERVFRASERALLGVSGLGRTRLIKLMDPQLAAQADAELDRATEAGVRLIRSTPPNTPPCSRAWNTTRCCSG